MNTSHENTIGVFISYNRQDHLLAKTFAQHVHELGMKPWVDFEGLIGGDQWKQGIETALRDSLVVLVLLTPEAVNSVWVRYEINRAIANGRKVIPLIIRPCTLPPELEEVQFIDFRSDTDLRFKELTKALMRTVVRPLGDNQNQADTQPDLTPEIVAMRETIRTEYPALAARHAAAQSTPQQRMALVIEDQEPTQRFLREVLLDLGFDVHVAATRSQVMDFIRKHKYHFITLDMNLDPTIENEHGQDGILLLNYLKRYQEQVPVVIISGVEWNPTQMRDFFVKHGVKDVLSKNPVIDTGELQALVLKHTGEAGGQL